MQSLSRAVKSRAIKTHAAKSGDLTTPQSLHQCEFYIISGGSRSPRRSDLQRTAYSRSPPERLGNDSNDHFIVVPHSLSHSFALPDGRLCYRRFLLPRRPCDISVDLKNFVQMRKGQVSHQLLQVMNLE